MILDPNTANSYLILSDDLTSLRTTTHLNLLPKNPERCQYSCVLGSEGFNSGKHFWDVETGSNSDWIFGITTASNPRTTDFFKTNVWCLWHRDNNYFTQSPKNPNTPLTVWKKLQRIRVQLDCDRGRVSFFDLVTDKYLHTLTTARTETLFPFLYTLDMRSLRILPVKVFVTVEKSRWHWNGSCMTPQQTGLWCWLIEIYSSWNHYVCIV